MVAPAASQCSDRFCGLIGKRPGRPPTLGLSLAHARGVATCNRSVDPVMQTVKNLDDYQDGR